MIAQGKQYFIKEKKRAVSNGLSDPSPHFVFTNNSKRVTGTGRGSSEPAISGDLPKVTHPDWECTMPDSCPVVFAVLPHWTPVVSSPEVPLQVQQTAPGRSSVVNPLRGLQSSRERMTGPDAPWITSPSKNQEHRGNPKPDLPASLLKKLSVHLGDKGESLPLSLCEAVPLCGTLRYLKKILLEKILWSDSGASLHLKEEMWRGPVRCPGRGFAGRPWFTEATPAGDSGRADSKGNSCRITPLGGMSGPRGSPEARSQGVPDRLQFPRGQIEVTGSVLLCFLAVALPCALLCPAVFE